MLVLTRRLNQSIQIGDDITITIVEVRGDQVRIGIEAPRSMQIYRAEVLLQVRQENAAASLATTEDIEAALGLLPAPAGETEDAKTDQ